MVTQQTARCKVPPADRLAGTTVNPSRERQCDAAMNALPLSNPSSDWSEASEVNIAADGVFIVDGLMIVLMLGVHLNPPNWTA